MNALNKFILLLIGSALCYLLALIIAVVFYGWPMGAVVLLWIVGMLILIFTIR